MRTFSVLAIVSALAVVLSGCGSGGTSNRSTATSGATGTPVSDETFRAAAERAANSTLLTRADFPTGWSIDPGNSSSEPDLKVSDPACQEIMTSKESFPGAVVQKKSESFSGGREESVNSEVGIYRTVAEAEKAQADVLDFLGRCRVMIETAFTQYLHEQPGVVSGEVKLTDEPDPQKGDWSHAYAFRMIVKGAARTVHVATQVRLFRHGRVCGSVSYDDDGTFPPASGARLVGLVANRLSKAATTLP